MPSKLVLLSLLIATVALPMRAAKLGKRGESYKKLWRWMYVLCLFYELALVYIYPRLENN